MKTRLILAAALFAGMIGQSFASCDVMKEDDQAQCAAKCDDYFIRHKQDMMADHSALVSQKKECDTKCGCPQNSK